MKTLGIGMMAVMMAGGVMASKPIQMSITPGIALYNRHEKIEGVVLGIWSQNPQKALALGIVSGSTGNSSGLSWSLLLNYADNYKGIHWAPINYTKSDFTGWQAGFVNYTGGAMKGLQSGTVNIAGRLTGLQLGLANYAETAENGVQIGLINIIPQNAWFTELPEALAPGMVFVNWRF